MADRRSCGEVAANGVSEISCMVLAGDMLSQQFKLILAFLTAIVHRR